MVQKSGKKGKKSSPARAASTRSAAGSSRRATSGRAEAGRHQSRAERTVSAQREIQRRGERLRDEREKESAPRKVGRTSKGASASTSNGGSQNDLKSRVGRGSNGESASDSKSRMTSGSSHGGKNSAQASSQNGRGARRSEKSPVQAGTRAQPEPPQPKQQLEKPGLESELDPKPRFMAPDYRGSEKLQDMVAIITGGDSGIGRAVAVLFAREGADVVVCYLSEHGDARETKLAVEKEGRRCLLLPGDVSDPDYCEDVIRRTMSEFGRLDVLVNNAAFQLHQESIEDITPEQFDMTMRTNLYGYFYMTRAALPHLKEGSSIINTGSVVGLYGHKSLVDYAMTKGAIHNFTQSLAQNVAEKGIRVNCVAPGPVWTPLNAADQDADDVAKFGESVLMKRPAQPEELSPAYVFLASPVCASYITGEIIGVLGGEKGSG